MNRSAHSGSVVAEGNSSATATLNPQRRAKRKKRSNTLAAVLFVFPAALFLGALVIYPVIYSIIRSLYSARGDKFVGLGNYATMFTSPATFTAIKNNVIWVLVVPLACTVLGLIFAVLMDKIRWSTAFKLIIFMPMAISMLAAGVIFRTMFQESPKVGVVNAAITSVQSFFSDQSSYPGARHREDVGLTAINQAIGSEQTVSPGSIQNFPLIGIRADDLGEDPVQGVEVTQAAADEIAGTVWLDVIRGGGGTQGVLDPGKSGLEGVHVDAVDPNGQIAASAVTEADGTFTLTGLDPGTEYTIVLPASNFGEGPQGVSWLSSTFITAVVIMSYIWIWAGFAMVMISSGLSALDRSALEAARVDGANDWQVFTRITVPMLAPVLTVVMVTLTVNVLKIFDLVYVIPPGAAKPAANVIAVEMWNVSFGGGNDQGVGSALAVLLLILVVPVMVINARRFKSEEG